MQAAYMADVGDGLCLALRTAFGDFIQVDCGTEQGGEVAFQAWQRVSHHVHGAFVLSHFHTDHYNGLLYAAYATRRPASFHVDTLYYPRIPEIDRRRELFHALLAMAAKVFGQETGIMEYDLIRAVARLSGSGRVRYSPLAQGDEFGVDGSVFRVLWPPRTIDDRDTLAAVRRALADFEGALEVDPQLRDLYGRVAEAGVYERYFRTETGEAERQDFRDDYVRTEGDRAGPLPELVDRANRSLRKAANHLGLIFYEDNRVLVLGDADSHELSRIVDDLAGQERTRFCIIVTPHHGTHWHDSLRRLKCVIALTSNGPRRQPDFRPEFKEISRECGATFINGDLIVPDGAGTREAWWHWRSPVPW